MRRPRFGTNIKGHGTAAENVGPIKEDMPRSPSKAAIAAEERGLLERQRVFRSVADRLAAALSRCQAVEAIALIGSVACPLQREVPRFAPYRQSRPPIAHECKDVDLAVWVSRLGGLDELRRRQPAFNHP